MSNLLSLRTALEQRLKSGGRILLCLDYDGTLAPIRDRPEQALLPERTRAILERLASAPGVVGVVISGRALEDLRRRVGIPEFILAGNHGLEMEGRGLRFLHPGATARRGRLARLCEELRSDLSGISGAEVENKGLTATVHFRRAAPGERHRVTRVVREVTSGLSEAFEVRSGLMSLEIRPLVNWDKGVAVRMVLADMEPGCRTVIYLGDDQTDEDAFEALKGHVTVKVGLAGHTAAQWRVSGPDEVADFLELLCALASARRAEESV